MLAQEITECQRASFFLSAGFNNVNMVRVPFPGPMKERAEGVVSMMHVNVAERCERLCIQTNRLQVSNRNLYVNDWLRFKPRNGGRAVMLDAVRYFAEHMCDAIPFRLKSQNPAWIV